MPRDRRRAARLDLKRRHLRCRPAQRQRVAQPVGVRPAPAPRRRPPRRSPHRLSTYRPRLPGRPPLGGSAGRVDSCTRFFPFGDLAPRAADRPASFGHGLGGCLGIDLLQDAAHADHAEPALQRAVHGDRPEHRAIGDARALQPALQRLSRAQRIAPRRRASRTSCPGCSTGASAGRTDRTSSLSPRRRSSRSSPATSAGVSPPTWTSSSSARLRRPARSSPQLPSRASTASPASCRRRSAARTAAWAVGDATPHLP